MAQRYFYTWIHETDGVANDSFIPSSYAISYWNSLIFDPNHRTIWHQGMPYGNAYPGTASYGEVFNDIDHNIGKAAYGHAEGCQTTVTYVDGDTKYSAGAHAEGYQTNATALASHAEGNVTIASGVNSHSEGNMTVASGESTHVEGFNTKAENKYGHAEGNTTISNGESSHAEGDNTTAKGTSSHSEGTRSNAIGNYSHAEGNDTIARGEAAHSEGNNTNASSNYSHAEGKDTSVSGVSGHAEGTSTTVSGASAHAEGYAGSAIGTYSHTEGNSNSSSGESSHTEGNNNTAMAKSSHAEGASNKIYVNSTYSHVEGTNNKVNGKTNHIEGSDNSTDSTSTYVHVEGYKNVGVQGTASHVGGFNNTSTGNYLLVTGQNNTSNSSASIVSGNKNTDKDGTTNLLEGEDNTLRNSYNSIISGKKNTGIGSNNIISGTYTYVKGNNNLILASNTSAYTYNSIAIGDSISIEGDQIKEGGNFALGKGIQIVNDHEGSVGKYNFSYYLNFDATNANNDNKTVFSVGVGTSDDDRRNAIDIRETGVAYLYTTSYIWDNGWELGQDVFPQGLYPIATTSYVLRHGVGMKNWIKDESGVQAYTTSEYFNIYDGPYQNKAYGPYGHAEGKKTYVYYTAEAGHAEGIGTEVKNDGEHASGRYNQSIEDCTLFSIGNGNSNIDRSNQFTVYYGIGASDGLAKLQNDVIVANRSGISATDENLNWFTDSKATYLWSGSYTNYKSLIKAKGTTDTSTIYFIEDGDANDRNDFVTKDDITYIIDKVNAVTDKKMHGVVKSASSIVTSDPLLAAIANSCSSPADTTYIWTGSDVEYSNIKSSIDEILSSETNTSYWIVKSMQFVIHNH